MQMHVFGMSFVDEIDKILDASHLKASIKTMKIIDFHSFSRAVAPFECNNSTTSK